MDNDNRDKPHRHYNSNHGSAHAGSARRPRKSTNGGHLKPPGHEARLAALTERIRAEMPRSVAKGTELDEGEEEE